MKQAKFMVIRESSFKVGLHVEKGRMWEQAVLLLNFHISLLQSQQNTENHIRSIWASIILKHCTLARLATRKFHSTAALRGLSIEGWGRRRSSLDMKRLKCMLYSLLR